MISAEEKARRNRNSLNWKRRNKDKVRSSKLLDRYGITLEQYNEMTKAQDSKCFLCGLPEKNGRSLSVDHCHKTGLVRKLLCQTCNAGIGILENKPELLGKFFKYLITWSVK